MCVASILRLAQEAKMELVQVTFDKILQTRSYTIIELAAEGKKFAIYVEPVVGKILQLHLTDAETARPLTHDLVGSIFRGLDITVKQVVISDLQETTYFARLFLEQMRGEVRHIVEIDIRPSDAIILALMFQAPIYCAKEVLEKTVPAVE